MNWTDQWLPFRSDERKLFLLAAGWFFCLLSSYYILKPIREAMGVELGVGKLPSLFLATMLAMLVALPIYNLLVAKLSRRRLLLAVYQFFVLCILGFVTAYWLLDLSGRLVVARVYFVWVSVFAMWSVSLFWSVAADIFDSESAKRLFGPIAAAGTVGAIASSLLASQLSGRLGVVGLWIAAAIVLQVGLLLGLQLEKIANQLLIQRFAQAKEKAGFDWTGGLDGVLRELLWPIVKDLFTSPYLLGITVYICLIALGGTTVYSLLNYEVGLSFKESADRVSFFAGLNLGVQLVTVLLQSLLSASLLRSWGVGRTLMLLPLAYLLIFALLGWQLNLTMVAGGFVLASSLAYGLTVPARELLFTVVDKSAKYRTKTVIDTVLFRTFDYLASLGVELSLKQQYLFGYLLGLVAISSAWCSLGFWLGKKQQKKAADLESAAETQDSTSDPS